MESSEALNSVDAAMKKAVEHTSSEFTSIRTGKASPALVENLDVSVPSYGSVMTPLSYTPLPLPTHRPV